MKDGVIDLGVGGEDVVVLQGGRRNLGHLASESVEQRKEKAECGRRLPVGK